MRKFYLVYQKQQTVSVNSVSKIPQTASAKSPNPFKLSWSHYLQLIKIENKDERNFYEIEAINNAWSVREFERQYDSSLYE